MWEDKIELCLTSIYHAKLFPDPKPIEKDSCDEQTWSWVNPVTCKKDRSGMGIHVSQYLQLSFVGTDRIVGTSSNFRCMDPQSSTLGQAARRCRSSPGMLPIGTNCIQLLELMSINLSMATTWQSDIRYHSESQWRSHIYIVAKHVVFFLVFVLGMRGTELGRVAGSLVMSCPPFTLCFQNVLVTSENVSHSKTGFDWVSRCLSCSMQIPVKPAVTLGHGWDVSRPASILDVIEVGWRMDIGLWLDWLSARFC